MWTGDREGNGGHLVPKFNRSEIEGEIWRGRLQYYIC